MAKLTTCIFLSFLLSYAFANGGAYAVYDMYGGEETIGVGVVRNDIVVHNATSIINDGTIGGTLGVCDGCELFIENRGIYNAVATLGTGATITQVIKTGSDITTLENINTDYGVLIQDTEGRLNWSDIRANTVNANQYTFDNANIIMDDFDNLDSVTLTNDVFIYTHDVPISDTLLFSNVSGGGGVYVDSDNIGVLYTLETYHDGANNVYVHMVRSVDYGRILNNDTGRFLNLLREKSPDDKLLNKLYFAKTPKEVDKIVSKSVRVNPIKLMQPIRSMYSHKTLEIMHIDNEIGLGIMPISIFSDDMSLIGVGPNAHFKISDDLQIKLFGNISYLEYADDINEYSGVSYGVGTDVVYNLSENNFVRAYGEFDFSIFDTWLVFDGKGLAENPSGISGYIVGEFGHKFNMAQEYYLSPFMMVGTDYAKVYESDEGRAYMGAGGDFGYGFDIDGLRYDYAVRMVARTDGCYGAGLNISVWSIMDDAGADAMIGIMDDDIIGMSYRISLNAKFNF